MFKKDLLGRTFGRLTVVGFSHTDKRAVWNCRCSCGNVCKVKSLELLNGDTKSCGCIRHRKWDPVDRGDYFDIPLANGMFCKIDKEDIDKVKDLSWTHLRSGKKILYARSKDVLMHKVIMDAKEVDHFNHDGLDNRKINLRECSRFQNSGNRLVSSQNKLGIKGVREKGKKFQARILERNLGHYDTVEEAKAAYDKAALEVFGSFACK